MVGSIHIYRVNDSGAILEGRRDESWTHANSQRVSHSLNLELASELGLAFSLCPQVSAQTYILSGDWILLLFAACGSWISSFLT